MAKTKPVKKSKTAPPSSLTMSLYAPGMTVMHRAGLGGLACTLKYIERKYQDRILGDDNVPGGPWSNGEFPWTIDESKITLHFGEAKKAGEYLEKLFRIAFGIKDDLIYIPGQYETEPNVAVRAELQAGLTLTFLQHGKVRSLAKENSVYQYDVSENEAAKITVEYKQCSAYKHQQGWKDICDSNGNLKTKTTEVVGPLNPGAKVRHVAFSGATKLAEPPCLIMPLYFAVVGCLAIPINRGSGVLLIPDVDDLNLFSVLRPLMTPTASRDCRIGNASDAALQAQIRLRVRRLVDDSQIPGCRALTFMPTQWDNKQKYRVRALEVPQGDTLNLEQFEVALVELAPRVKSTAKPEDKSKKASRKKRKKEDQEWFWTDSIVRPLVADNLAMERAWYQGFVDLMLKLDPASGQPLRNKLSFEKKGLHAMIEKIPWQDQGEAAVVKAVHEAMRRRYAIIADENKDNLVAMRKRWTGEDERWRLAFSGAKTTEQFRRSLCDLFSRAGRNSILQEYWEQLLPMFTEDRWALTRDLSLLALASYKGSDEAESIKDE